MEAADVLKVLLCFPARLGRMSSGVDGFEFVDADLRIDGGGVQVGMSEQVLDVADIRAAFEHVRGARMA